MQQSSHIARILEAVPQLSQAWAAERHERQQRTGGDPADYQALRALGVSLMAEALLERLCKLSGGSAYTCYSPLGGWFEDVRALGYLRPPWALAFDQMYNASW